MAYNGIKTWTNEPLVAADMNDYINDNLDALKNPPSAAGVLNEGSDFSTSSTAVANVDSGDVEGKLRHTITTTGGDIMVHFHGTISISADNTGAGFMCSVDGVTDPDGADSGYLSAHRIASSFGAGRIPISFTRILSKDSYAAGVHVIRLQWRALGAGGGTIALYAGAGTTGVDIHPQFWVREI